jgi:dTDP-4-dehydrorhamnose reductase
MAGHLMTLYLRKEGGLDVADVGPRRAVFPGTLIRDLEDPATVRKLVRETEAQVVVNCTGVLVRASEERKREAVWFNSYLPHLLAECCAESGARLIHLSTDCVFSGAKGPYTEASFRDGEAFYDRSKSLGELEDGSSLTIRTSIIGPELRSEGSGLLDWAMRQRGTIRGYRKALWSGVTTLELAKFVLFCIEKKAGISGLVHFSVAGGISKYDLLRLVNEVYGKGLTVEPTDEPVLDKRLICTRRDLGTESASYAEQLKALKAWTDGMPELYPHYSERR